MGPSDLRIVLSGNRDSGSTDWSGIMILVIGGKYQGKLEYVLEKCGYSKEDVATKPGEGKPVLYGLQDMVRENTQINADSIDAEVVICDEVGSGIIPMEYSERLWREQTGRLCCALAKKADRVIRITCGMPMAIKGDLL